MGCYFMGCIWFGVCWRSVAVWLWRCGVFMQSAVCEGCCKQQTSQCSHPQRSTTVPQPATSNTTSKYTTYAITRGLFS